MSREQGRGDPGRVRNRLGTDLSSVGEVGVVLVVQLDSLGVQIDSLGPVPICESLVALVLKLYSFFLRRRHLFRPRNEAYLLSAGDSFLERQESLPKKREWRAGQGSSETSRRLLKKPWRRKRNRWILLALGCPQDLGTLRNRKPLLDEIG